MFSLLTPCPGYLVCNIQKKNPAQPCWKMATERKCHAKKFNFHRPFVYQVPFPVNLFRSPESRADSSSDHLSPSSPTAKIVSPSNDSRWSGGPFAGFGGTGESPLLAPFGVRRSGGERASSSPSNELAMELISNPSSSCASYSRSQTHGKGDKEVGPQTSSLIANLLLFAVGRQRYAMNDTLNK